MTSTELVATAKWRSRPIAPVPGIEERFNTFYTQFIHRDSDILFPAFPKAGTHWLHHIVYKLIQQDANFKAPEKEHNFIEFQKLDELNKLSSPRILNTHAHVCQLPEEALKCKKIIYILRNPKDTAVSSYHHVKSMNTSINLLWEDYFNVICQKSNEDEATLNWFLHTREWWTYLHQQRTPGSFLILRYEEILNSPSEHVQSIADFLEIPCSQQLKMDIVEATKINKLRDSAQRPPELDKKAPFIDKSFSFYRKGIVGDWKNLFTIAQNEHFDRLYFEEEKMQDLNLELEKYMV